MIAFYVGFVNNKELLFTAFLFFFIRGSVRKEERERLILAFSHQALKIPTRFIIYEILLYPEV